MESDNVEPAAGKESPNPARETSSTSRDVTAGAPLNDVEREVLVFAARPWRYEGSKEAAIGDRFGWSATRYYQVLGALLERPEAAEHAPVLVARLRRLAEGRRRQRSIEERGLDGDV